LSTHAQSSGNDILFTSSDGTTKLSHEIERYTSSTGALVCWVKVPSLSSSIDSVLYMYYGNPSASDQSAPAGVWDGNYKAVWHLREDPSGTAPQIRDSTTNANNGASYGSMSSADLVDARIGKGIRFDGTNDYVNVGNGASLNFASGSAFTFSSWVKTSDNYGNIVSFRNSGTGNPVIDVAIGYNGVTTTAGHFIPLMRYDDGSGLQYFSSTVNIADNVWHHVVFVYSPSDQRIYACVDGTAWQATQTATGSITTLNQRVIASEQRWVADNYGTADQRYLGAIIDEVRVSNVARSASWIVSEYNNQNSPSTFYSLGAEQTNKLVLTVYPSWVIVGSWTTVYTVQRQDPDGNPVTLGATTVYLTSSSTGANKKFSESPGGSSVTSVTIPDGSSSKDFYYYDDTPGAWIISVQATDFAGDSKSLIVIPIVTTTTTVSSITTTTATAPTTTTATTTATQVTTTSETTTYTSLSLSTTTVVSSTTRTVIQYATITVTSTITVRVGAAGAVGAIIQPTNILLILAPYLAAVSLIASIAFAVIKRRRRA
jgi:hypothetical protein